MNTLPDTYGVPEVANLLGRSQRWVNREANAGRIPHIRAGRTGKRFTREHVEAILRTYEVPAAPRSPLTSVSGNGGLTARSRRARRARQTA